MMCSWSGRSQENNSNKLPGERVVVDSERGACVVVGVVF
jgi:hypothetical protein